MSAPKHPSRSVCRSCGTTGASLKQEAHREVCERADVVTMEEAAKPTISPEAQQIIVDLIPQGGLSYNDAIDRAERRAEEVAAPYREAARVIRGWFAAGGHNRV